MSSTYIPQNLRREVAERCQYRCCYCQTAQEIIGAEFTIDHIIPESLGGLTTLENLCLACWSCNLIKHNRIAALDPETAAVVQLFNPNTQDWSAHFRWDQSGLIIVGITSTGRATVNGLQLNRSPLVNSRRLWVSAGWHPPGG